MLNQVSDWTDQFDRGCQINDESFTAAYFMYRRTVFDLNTLKNCGVQGLPEGPLQNCQICCSSSGTKQPLSFGFFSCSESTFINLTIFFAQRTQITLLLVHAMRYSSLGDLPMLVTQTISSLIPMNFLILLRSKSKRWLSRAGKYLSTMRILFVNALATSQHEMSTTCNPFPTVCVLCSLGSMSNFMTTAIGTQVHLAGPSADHDEEQCSTRLSCARAQSKRGALYDVHGMLGAVCIHDIPVLGTFCDLRGPENFVYYLVSIDSTHTGPSLRFVCHFQCHVKPLITMIFRLYAPPFLQVLLSYIALCAKSVGSIFVDFGCRLSKSWERYIKVRKESETFIGHCAELNKCDISLYSELNK